MLAADNFVQLTAGGLAHVWRGLLTSQLNIQGYDGFSLNIGSASR